jgi:hypothetical protein
MVNKLRKRINNLKNLFEARNDMFIKKSELIKDFFRIILNGEPYRILNEERKSFGRNNSNKTFYIIRIYPGAGLLSNYFFVLNQLFYAKSKNWISVVDFMNYPNYYREQNKINGTKNSWEYYFKQPYEYNLKDVYSSSNVYLSSNSWGDLPKKLGVKNNFELLNDSFLLENLNIVNKNIEFNRFTSSYINNKINQLFGDKSNILGVSLRGTDYANASLSPEHPTPPTVDLCIEKVVEICESKNYEYIYLATEQQEYLEKFKKTFGSNLLYFDRNRFIEDENSNKKIIKRRFERNNDRYLTGLDYLTETEGFKKVDFFIGSMNNMTLYLMIKYPNLLNNKFIFDLGKN